LYKVPIRILGRVCACGARVRRAATGNNSETGNIGEFFAFLISFYREIGIAGLE
jgi:hypothetical protein